MNSFNRELAISPCYASDNSSASSINTAGPTALDEEVYATVETSGPKRRAGRKKFRETRHPVYKGVRRRNGSKWVCEVREPNKKSRIWLGTYPTAEMAARAHDVAAMALRGRRACLNFADSAWRLPMPVSSSAKDIQKAAAEAAEAFRPSDSDDASTDDSDIAPEKLTLSQEEAAEAFRASDSNEASNDDSDIALENLTLSQENALYMDEEAVFGMPGLLASMAEGFLLSPPLCLGSGPYWDDVETEVDMSLWSY